MTYGSTYSVRLKYSGNRSEGQSIIRQIMNSLKNSWFKSHVTSRRFKLVTTEKCAKIKGCKVTDIKKHEVELYVPMIDGKWPDGFKQGSIGIDHNKKEGLIEIFMTSEGDTVKREFWPIIKPLVTENTRVRRVSLTEYEHLQFEAVGKPEKIASIVV